MKQILAKLPFAMACTMSRLVAARSRTLTRNFLRAADAGEAAVFEKPQQLGLERPAHVRDFIEEDGSAIGFFDPSGLLFDGAGKRALFVAEQFAFQQRFGILPQFMRT